MNDRRDVWISTDDNGTKRRCIVDYDNSGNALVSREAIRQLLTQAGLRLEMNP